MKSLIRSRKGFNINDVPTLAILLVVIAVVLGVGMTILSQIQESTNCDDNYALDGICYVCSTSHTWNATAQTCYIGGAANATAKAESRTIGFNVTHSGVEGLEDLENGDF